MSERLPGRFAGRYIRVNGIDVAVSEEEFENAKASPSTFVQLYETAKRSLDDQRAALASVGLNLKPDFDEELAIMRERIRRGEDLGADDFEKLARLKVADMDRRRGVTTLNLGGAAGLVPKWDPVVIPKRTIEASVKISPELLEAQQNVNNLQSDFMRGIQWMRFDEGAPGALGVVGPFTLANVPERTVTIGNVARAGAGDIFPAVDVGTYLGIERSSSPAFAGGWELARPAPREQPTIPLEGKRVYGEE